MTTDTMNVLSPRILVVEDTLMLADVLVDQLQEFGCQVVGPAGHVQSGVALAEREALDGALLDINLRGERCFPIARILAARSIPFAFLTGYGDAAIEPEFRDIPRLMKPYAGSELAKLVQARFGSGH